MFRLCKIFWRLYNEAPKNLLFFASMGTQLRKPENFEFFLTFFFFFYKNQQMQYIKS